MVVICPKQTDKSTPTPLPVDGGIWVNLVWCLYLMNTDYSVTGGGKVHAFDVSCSPQARREH